MFEKGAQSGFRLEYMRNVLLDKGYEYEDVWAIYHQMKDRETPSAPRPTAPIASPRKRPQRLTFVLGLLCIILAVALVFTLTRPPKIVEVEKVVETTPQIEVSGDVREKLDQFGDLSAFIDSQQKQIDDQMSQITGLSVSLDDREAQVEKQSQQLRDLNVLMKEERKQVISLLVEVLNYILGQQTGITG